MSEKISFIPSRVKNCAEGGHVAGARDIIDDGSGITLDELVGNKEYNSADFSGMGRVVLKKNIVDGVNTLIQEMMSDANTIYVIQYDFTLGEDITVPANCVLEFNGGSISANGSNDTIIGQDTKLICTDNCLHVILDGTFTNKNIYGEWFGVKEGVTNAIANDTAFASYIIPSMSNISNGYPYTSKVLSINCDFFINSPIVVNGDYNIEFRGSISYGGDKNSTALTIGLSSKNSREREYFIHDIGGNQSLIKTDDTINNYVGIKFINVQASKITVEYCGNFSYPIILLADINGIQNNIMYFNLIGKSCYTGLKLETNGTSAWIKENLFICGKIANYTDNPCYSEAIGLEMNGFPNGYVISANLFLKLNIEGMPTGIKTNRAQYNNFIGTRIERVDNIMNDSSGYGYLTNCITYSDTDNISVPNKYLSSISKLSDISFNAIPVISIDNCVKLQRIASGKYISNLEGYNNSDGANPVGAQYFGHEFDIVKYTKTVDGQTVEYVNNIICTETDKNSLIGFILYDQNGNMISKEDAPNHIENVGAFRFNDNNVSCIWTTEYTTKTIISVKDTVSKVFVGCSKASMPNTFIVRGIGIRKHQRFNYPSENLKTIEIVDEVKFGHYSGFYNNMLSGRTLILYADIDLDGYADHDLSGVTIVLKGGKFKNGGIRMNGCKIIGDFNDLLGTGGYLSGSSTPAAGTYKFENGNSFWHNGTAWVDITGVIAGTPTSGTFANKPTVSANKIPVGFKYFCTDKQTTEGATNGIEIIHKGNDVWVDALGRVVS